MIALKSLSFSIFFGIILSILCLPKISLAAVYYVDNYLSSNCISGNYSIANRACNGSNGNAYTTIQAAVNAATVAGDIVSVRSGNYPERITLATNSGINGNVITYSAYTDATIGGSENVIMKGFNLNGVSHITIRGFEITNIGFNNYAGIRLSNADYINISHNYIHELEPSVNGYGGIRADTNTNSYVTIENNILYKVEGMGIIVVGDHWTVANNEVYRGRDARTDGTIIVNDCDAMRVFGTNHIITNNYLHDYLWADMVGNPHVDAIMSFTNGFGTPFETADVVFEGNFIRGFSDQWYINNDIDAGDYVHRIKFRNNVFADVGEIGSLGGTGQSYGINLYDCNECEFTNNTFAMIDSAHYAGHPFRASTKEEGSINMIIKNNIFYGFGAADGISIDINSQSGLQMDYNLWATNFTWPPKISGQDAHSLFSTNPLFMNSLAYDFRLTPNSPAINSGMTMIGYTIDKDGNFRPNGSAWDIGAYEYVEVAPPPDTIPPSAPTGLTVL